MKHLLASVCAATLSIAATTGAATANDHDWYVSVFGGAAFFDDYDFNFISGAGTAFPYSVDNDTGYLIGGAIGVKGLFVENLRGEIELSYMSADPGAYASVPPTFVGIAPTGDISVFNVMANLWYDIDTGTSLMPYVGGGLGVGFADGSLTVTNGAGAQYNGDDVGLAFQAGVGVLWGVTENTYLDVSYRFRGVTDVNFASSIAGFTTDSNNVTAHTIQAGFIFKIPVP